MIAFLSGLLLFLLCFLPGRKAGSVCRLEDLVMWCRGR